MMKKNTINKLLAVFCSLCVGCFVGAFFPILPSINTTAQNVAESTEESAEEGTEESNSTESIDDSNILELRTTNAAWYSFSDMGTRIKDVKLVAESTQSDHSTASVYTEEITKDAVSFTLKAGTVPSGELVNTMWTVRSQMNSGNYADFPNYTGYHIVLYPNTGRVLCITNPQINVYNDVVVGDLKSILFDGAEHKVVVGATDLEDGSVKVFLDVDGKNIWNWTDTTVKIAKAGTSFAVAARNEKASWCELPNYTISGVTTDVPVVDSDSVTDEQITKLVTGVMEWTSFGPEGTRIEEDKLIARSTMGDHSVTSWYNEEITTDAVAFKFQSGEIPAGDTINTMWTVRAQMNSGSYADFPQYTGYHIVLYPNTGHVLCITNPQINIYNDIVIDLKSILFDGEEHEVVLGAVDLENGSVKVFLDVDGKNIWNWTDTSVKISKTGTSFAVGARNEIPSSCELPNYDLIGLIGVPPQAPEHTTFELKNSDFNKSGWDVYQSITLTGDSLLCTSSATHATAKYAALRYEGQDAIKFKLNIGNVKDNIMMATRVDPKGGQMWWNCSYILLRMNLKSWDIIVNWNNGNVQGTDWTMVKAGSFTTPLELNKTYDMEFGVVEKDDVSTLFLIIDGELAISVEDNVNFPKVSADGKTFMFGSYDASVYTVAGVDSEGLTTNVERPNNDLATSALPLENWANILNAYNPDMEKNEEDNSLTLDNKGGIAYADCLNLSQIDFDFSFSGKGTSFVFMFNKARRGTYFDSYLQQSEYKENKGYGIVVQAEGMITIVKQTSGAYFLSTNSLKLIMGEPFEADKSYHMTITFETYETETGVAADIAVYLNGALEGYKVTDPTCGVAYQQGYIGVQKMNYDEEITLSNLCYEGETVDTDEGKNTEVKNVYLPQFYAKDKHNFAQFEGKNFLRWSYAKDNDYIRSISIKSGSTTLTTVEYPTNEIEIPDEYVGQTITITVNTVDDTFSNLEYVLQDNRASYEVDEERYGDRIAIRENNVTGIAEFYYNDGVNSPENSRRFIPVGHNYLLLKDSWEASNFEASSYVTLNNYDPMETEAMLALLAKNNYNSLRMFLGSMHNDTVGGMAGSPSYNQPEDFWYYNGKAAFYQAYMDNLIDFMTRCQKYGIYCLFVLGVQCPQTELFHEANANFHSINTAYLTNIQIEGKKMYVEALTTYFQEYDRNNGTQLMNTIFALSNDNESYYNGGAWPFNTKDTLTFANGKTYNMDSKDDRQAAADEGKLYFYEQISKKVKEMDSELLFCEGTFTLFATNNYSDENPTGNYGISNNGAFPTTLDVMLKSAIDFMDVHLYYTADMNNADSTMDKIIAVNMRSMKYGPEVRAMQAKKPIIMGEFGAFRSNTKNDFEKGKEIISGKIDLLLSDTYAFQGFMVWQLNEFKQTELYCMLEDDAKYLEGDLRYIYLETAQLITDEGKINYTTGETLDFSGLKVRCTYSDGSTKDIAVTSDMYWNEEDVDMNVVGDKTIELLFEEWRIFEYTVHVEQGTTPPVDSGDDSTGSDDSSADSNVGTGNDDSSTDNNDSNLDNSGDSDSSTASSSESESSENVGCFGTLKLSVWILLIGILCVGYLNRKKNDIKE